MDANVAASTIRALRAQGHDVVSVAEDGLFDVPDLQIVERARHEGGTIVTYDQDFGRLLALAGAAKPSVIILRLEDQTPGYATPRLLTALGHHAEALAAGAIVIVEDSQVRVRLLPIER